MEIQAQAEFIEVKSPIDRFRDEWAKLPGKAFLRQRKLLLQGPELVQYAELARVRGWKPPLAFALQGLLLAAFLLSFFSWVITRDEGHYADEIVKVQAELESQLKTEEAVINSSQFEIKNIQGSRKTSGFAVASSTNLTKDEALLQLNALMEETNRREDEYKFKAAVKKQNLRAAGDGFGLAASGTGMVFSLALIFAAPLFGRMMQKQYGRHKLAAQADSYYLYYVTSAGLWLNLVFVIVLNVFLSNSAYGLGSIVEAVGSLGRTLFWLALYALMLYWFFTVSKALHKAMQLPRLKDYASPGNKVLICMHNSFWMAFVVFEAALCLLAYGVYVMERSK
jgi:hypothetical protein